MSAISFEGFTADLRYVGGCANGKAQGQGVVRAYRGQEVVAFFYGDWQSGQPRFGIVERPAQGYLVVEQVGGTLKSTDDRNAMIRAFALASQAATAASNAFLAQGNRASAEHYAATAKRLAEQVD